MPILSSTARIEDLSPVAKISSLIEKPPKYPPWSGVGEPGPHSIRLSQLTSIIKDHNPEVWGFYRERMTSLEQERIGLQKQMEVPDITYTQKKNISKRINKINAFVPDRGLVDEDLTKLIISSPIPGGYNLTHLREKLIETVPATRPDYPFITALWEGIKDIDLKEAGFNVAYTTAMPTDTPIERGDYEYHVKTIMAAKSKMEYSLKANPDNFRADMWRGQIAKYEKELAKHPDWESEDPFPKTPKNLQWAEWSNVMKEEAKADLEAIMYDAEKLALYKWARTKTIKDFTDFGKMAEADVIAWNLGNAMATLLPALGAGIVAGAIATPLTGLRVGMATMGIFEGSDEANQAMKYAYEQGLDLNEARHVANASTLAYAIGSTWIEGWAPGRLMRRLGLISKTGRQSNFDKWLFDRISKKSADKYAGAKRLFGKATDKIPFFVEASAIESIQELTQYLYQVSLQSGYQDTAGDTYFDRFSEIYDPSEAATSWYAGGLVGGVLGGLAGAAGRTSAKERREMVEEAEEVERGIAKVIPLEEVAKPTPEEVASDPLLDYVDRLSDIERTQLSPEDEPDKGAPKLDISIFMHKDDKSSTDKLLGLIEDVGEDVISAVELLSPEKKTDLLDRLMVQVNRENPGVDINTEEEAIEFLNVFSKSGSIVAVKEKVPLGEKAKVITKTKFDPVKMSKKAQQSIIKMGFDPKKAFIKPPEPKPSPPKVAPSKVPSPPIKPIIKPSIPKPGPPTVAQQIKMSKRIKAEYYVKIGDKLYTLSSVGGVMRKSSDAAGKKYVGKTVDVVRKDLEKKGGTLTPSIAAVEAPVKPVVAPPEDISEFKIVETREEDIAIAKKTIELKKEIERLRKIWHDKRGTDFEDIKSPEAVAAEVKKTEKENELLELELGDLQEMALNPENLIDPKATDEKILQIKDRIEANKEFIKDPFAGKRGPEAKVTAKDVHKAAEAVNMEWDDDAAFMALSKRVTDKERIDDMTSGERASLIAEIRKEVPAYEALKSIEEEGGVYHFSIEGKLPDTITGGIDVASENVANTITLGFQGTKADMEISVLEGVSPADFTGSKYDTRQKIKIEGLRPEHIDSKNYKAEQSLRIKPNVTLKLVGDNVYKVVELVPVEAPLPAVTDKEIIANEVTKSGIEVYKKFVTPDEEMYQSFKYIILTTGRKSFGWRSAWYGPIGYTYTGITHKRQKMPKEFSDLARQIEEATGVESGYYNSALVNLLPKGVSIGAHADDEMIFVRDNNTIGKVATVSLGGSTKITISGATKDKITVEAGDVYIMPGQGFQLKHKHAVGPSKRERISLTFRHIPKIRLKESREKIDKQLSKLTAPELKDIAEQQLIKGWKKMEKPELLQALKDIEYVPPKIEDIVDFGEDPFEAPKEPRLHVIGKDYVDKTPVADKETIQKTLIDIMGKHAPDVQDTFVKEIEESPEAVGRYVDGMVQFILGKATETTAVHEPIHWFVERVLSQKDYDFLHDKFLTNEAMVEAATDSYMKKKTFRGKVKSLFRKLWNAIKKFLGIKLTNDETVLEMFDRIGVEFDIRRPAVGVPRLHKPIEGDESEGKREDGVDFSQEVKPVEVSETDEGYVDAPNEQDEIVGNLYTNDYRSASLANYQSYFQGVFNRHISKASHAKMVEIAKRNKEAGFTQFFAEVREWAVNLLDENDVGVDINKTYSREQRAYMKQFFNKSNSRIVLFDVSTKESIKRTAGGRIFMDLFIQRGERGDIESFLFNYSLTEQLSTNPDGNKKRPSYYISNFTEDRNGPLTVHIRMDHIQEVVYNEKYDEERARVAKEKGVVYNVPREFLFPANIRITGGIIRQWDIVFADDFTNKGDENLMFVAGSKGGNDSVIFLGIVSEEHRNMNAAGFSEYLQSEVDRGFMTPDQRLEAISVAGDYSGTNNQIYGQIAGKHEWWKGVTGSNYLLRLRKGKPVNIREHFNRLRGPFSEGTNPLGIKDSRIMLIDSKEVKMNVNGKSVDLFPHAGVYALDGHLMSSGEWFRDLENNIGYLGNLYEAKTYINDLSEDLVDYISLKMMQMPPIAPGVQFTKDGKVIADVKLDSRTGRTYFVTPQGERFEHIGSDEEAKMVAGKYDRDVENGGLSEEDGFYKLHTLTSKNFKVLFLVSEKSKTDVAYPVAEAELALDKNSIGIEKFDMFISSIKTYYETVGNSWLDELYDFHVDSKKLRDELYRDLNTGQLPTDLQQWISMIGEDGKGIHIPHITKLISSYLNNKMINNGMYKVREKGMGTSLFVKPKAHLNIEQGEVFISARNTTYYDIVKNKYEVEGMAFISMMATLDREGAVQAMMEFDAKPIEDRVDELNRWLKANKSRNPLWVKIHRQPVTSPSVVLMRKISQLVLGEHGEAIFMTDQDLATLQSDSDGDRAGATHFKDKDLTNVLVAWHESDELKIRKKVVYTQAFLTDKNQTSMINYKHFIEAAKDTTVASGSQGIVTNSKTIGNLLAFKELKVKIRNPNRNKKGWTIEARQPSEEVIMSYAGLDKEALMENDGELYNLLIKQGDKIVSTTGKELALDELDVQKSLYLKTTHEHQMSTLLQFAVDDTSLGLLAKIGYDFKFITDRMWRNTDGSRIKNIAGIRHVLSEVRRIFNYSPMRKGIGSEGNLTMAENIIDSKALDNFLNMSKSEQSADLVYRINNAKKLANKWYYKGFHVESVSIETGRETPVESLLRLLAKKNNDMVNRPTPSDDNMLYTRDWSGTIGVFTEGSMSTAHVMAMKELEQNWDNTVVEKGVTKSDMAKAVKFIKKADPEFRDIFKDLPVTRTGKFIQPKPEHNDGLHDLVDKHIEEFNSLSENAQIYSTLYFLSGTATRTADGKPALRVNILRLLPLDLMHKETALKYAQTWWKMMNKPSHSVYKEQKDFRNETYKGFKFGAALELARKKNEESCG